MSLAGAWRNRGSRLRMEGAICHSCHKEHFPARPVCLECGSHIPLVPFITWVAMEDGSFAMREKRSLPKDEKFTMSLLYSFAEASKVES